MTLAGNLGIEIVSPCWMISRMNGAYFISSSPFPKGEKQLEMAYFVVPNFKANHIDFL
jgi:hypothetical protein